MRPCNVVKYKNVNQTIHHYNIRNTFLTNFILINTIFNIDLDPKNYILFINQIIVL